MKIFVIACALIGYFEIAYCKAESADPSTTLANAGSEKGNAKEGVHVVEGKEDSVAASDKDVEQEHADVSESSQDPNIKEMLQKLAKTAAEKHLEESSKNGEVSMTEEEMKQAADELAKKILKEAEEGKTDSKESLEDAVERLQKSMEEEKSQSTPAEKVEKVEGECILFSSLELSAEEVEKITNSVKVSSFRQSSDEELAKSLGVTIPGVFYKSNEGAYVFSLSSGENTVEGVSSKISKVQDIALVPVFGELYRENSQLYENLSIPIVYFVSRKQDFEKYKWAAPIAENLKSHLKIALLDYTSTEFFLNISGVHEPMLPALFIIIPNGKKLHKYLLTNAEDNERTIEFLEQCAYNIDSVKPYLMGEPRPSDEDAKNEAGVVNLVSSTFDEIALDPMMDTLVVYYAEWCNFCKNLLPGLDKLATALNGVSSDVVISRMLMSKNDVPLHDEIEPIQAYPTIRIYKKGTNKEIEFEIQDKPADAEGVLEFLKKHTDIPADLTLETATASKTAPMEGAKIPEEVKMDL
ncbi:protein disulfide-isomerase A1 [Nematocida parisii]|nr:protein disulfide-isomerase A1 [Nematocida parisii]KAI5129432.1 protein disulfide-isomerase A1 [Nematocida parisii]KAI5141987.1 protein disulfide-isomerase A1 [Nematocida parisii]